MSNEIPPVPDLAIPQPPPQGKDAYWAGQAEYAKSDPGFITSLGTTSILYDLGSAAFRSWYGGQEDPDWMSKNFNELPRLLESIPYEYHDDILGADSIYDAQQLRTEVLFKMRASARVGEEGAAGIAASLGIGALELAPLTVITGGTTLPAYMAGGGRLAFSARNVARVAQSSGRFAEAGRMAQTLNRMRLFAYGAGFGAGGGVAYTAIDSLVDPTTEADDFYMAAAFGGTLGGFANTLFGRSLVKNQLLANALNYENRLTMAGKELAVRFGADDVLDQVSTRFGVAREDAGAFIVGVRSLTDPANAQSPILDGIAVAGPKARLRAGQEVVREVEFAGGRAVVQQLNDGRTVLRSLQQADNVEGFVKGMGSVLIRSVAREDNDLLNNEDVLMIWDIMAGRNVRRSYRTRLTPGVETGEAPPPGLHAWEVRLGERFSGAASRWTPEVSEARKGLSEARTAYKAAMERLKAVIDDPEAELFATEADIFENLLALERRTDTIELVKELRAAAKAVKDAETKVRGTVEVDLKAKAVAELDSAKATLKERRAAVAAARSRLDEAGVAKDRAEEIATVKELRSLEKRVAAAEKKVSEVRAKDPDKVAKGELASAKKALKELRDEYKKLNKTFESRAKKAEKARAKFEADQAKKVDKAIKEERDAASRLTEAERTMGDIDAEYAIRRRKKPITSEEEERFVTAFLGWLKRNGTDGLPEGMAPVFEKVQQVLLRAFSAASDPMLGGVSPKPNVDLFFRDLFRKNISAKMAALERQSNSRLFSRLTAIANGRAVGEPDPISTVAPDSLPADWSDAPRTDPSILGVRGGWVASWLNQGLAAMTSDSGAIRWLGNRLFWARISPVDAAGRFAPQSETIREFIQRTRGILENKVIREFRIARDMFLHGSSDPATISTLNKAKTGWAHKKLAQFNQEVHAEILSPGSSTNEAVKKAANAFREHFKAMRSMAEEVGLPGFVGLEPDGSYFPRFWSWEMIDEFTKTEAGTARLAKMIRESIAIPIVESVDDPRFIAGEAITARGRDALALKTAERLRELARGTNKGAYTDMDEVMLQILMEEAPAPSKGKGPYMTPRGRRRIPMDISRKVRMDDGREMSLSELVNSDVMEGMTSYNRSVFGAMGEKMLVDEFRDQLVARGKMTADEAAERIKNWANIKEYLESSELRYGRTSKEVDRMIAHLDELMAGLRSEPAPMSFGALFSQYVGRLLKLGYLHNGQGFGLAAVNESARIAGRTSFTSVARQLPIVSELTSAAREGRIDPAKYPLMSLLDQTLGVASDRLRRSVLGVVDARLNRYDPSIRQGWWNSVNNWIRTKLDPNLNQATVLMSDVTGLAPVTSATQMLMAASLIQEVFESAKRGAVSYSDALLAQWGVTRPQFEAFMRKLSETARADAKGRVIDIDLSTWNGTDLGNFLLFVERGTVSSIQDPPVRGDFAKSFWTDWGRLLLQFRTFNMKGITNFLMTSSQRADARVFREYMMLGSLSLLTQMARKIVFAPTTKSEKEQKKYWEDSFSNKALLGYFMSGPTENYLLMGGIDSVAQFATGQTVFSQNVRYSGLGGSPFDVSGTPAWSALSNYAKAIRGPVQAMLREDRDFSQQDLNNLTNILWFRKVTPVFQGLNYLQNRVSGAFNLPEKSQVKVED
jgi:hypothetical protein